MGNYLSSPNATKHREDGRLGHVRYAICSMQGWRVSMEDTHLVHLFEYLSPPAGGPSVLFGVFDGHGGPQVAQFVSRHLIEELLKLTDFQQGHFDSAFRAAYVALDTLLREESYQPELEWFSQVTDGLPEDQCPYPPPPRVTPASVTLQLSRATSPMTAVTKNNRFRSSVRLGGRRLYVHCGEKRKKVPLEKQKVSTDSAALNTEENLGRSTTLESFSAAVSDEGLEQKVNDAHEETMSSSSSSSSCDVATQRPCTASTHVGCSTNSGELPRHSVRTTPRIITAHHHHASNDTSETATSTSSRGKTTSSGSVQDTQGGGVLQGLRSFFSSLMRLGSPTRQLPASHGLAMLAGCTATSVLVTTSQVIVANAGDSRAVLCRGAVALDLSKDHKPTLPEEKARIYSAGGWLDMGRVNGNLNLSRALGDHIYKMASNLPPDKQIISAVPDIIFADLQEDDEFLVIGCDGIWESYTSQEIVDFVRNRIHKTKRLSDILEALFEELLSPNPTLFEFGCDNMTAILVDLRPQQRRRGDNNNNNETGLPSSNDLCIRVETLLPHVTLDKDEDVVVQTNACHDQQQTFYRAKATDVSSRSSSTLNGTTHATPLPEEWSSSTLSSEDHGSRHPTPAALMFQDDTLPAVHDLLLPPASHVSPPLSLFGLKRSELAVDTQEFPPST